MSPRYAVKDLQKLRVRAYNAAHDLLANKAARDARVAGLFVTVTEVMAAAGITEDQIHPSEIRSYLIKQGFVEKARARLYVESPARG